MAGLLYWPISIQDRLTTADPPNKQLQVCQSRLSPSVLCDTTMCVLCWSETAELSRKTKQTCGRQKPCAAGLDKHTYLLVSLQLQAHLQQPALELFPALGLVLVVVLLVVGRAPLGVGWWRRRRGAAPSQGACEGVVSEAGTPGPAALLDVVGEDIVHPSPAVLEEQTLPALSVLLRSERLQELRGERRPEHECVCVCVTAVASQRSRSQHLTQHSSSKCSYTSLSWAQISIWWSFGHTSWSQGFCGNAWKKFADKYKLWLIIIFFAKLKAPLQWMLNEKKEWMLRVSRKCSRVFVHYSSEKSFWQCLSNNARMRMM